MVDSYRAAVSELLRQGKFEELDCLADTERAGKARFPGGMWKLRTFYLAITELPGHPVDADWQSALERVQKWMIARPRSITARVALAKVYIQYAWSARGTDVSDSVTDNGWKLLEQRLALAKSILDEAAGLSAKCPEWYSAMQDIAVGQEWEQARADDLLRQATTVEPDYYYLYRSHAYYLLPKWNGKDGDSSRFAAAVADRVGGDAGDILYFQVGAGLVCACDEPEFSRMSWPRLQKGYQLLEKKYGASVTQANSFALMAVKSGDSVAADEAFKKVGDSWEKDTWITVAFFNQMKNWAAERAPAEVRSRKILQEAAAGLDSPQGVEYQRRVEQALVPLLRQCSSNQNDQPQFEFLVQVGTNGSPDDAWPRQMTSVAQCLLKQLYDAHLKKETPFPTPPHPAYWLKIRVDPATITAVK